MVWMLLLVGALCVGAVLVANVRAQRQAANAAYQRAGALFSPAERSFLGVLDQAAGAEFRVFGKVRIADVLTPEATSNRRAWQAAQNRIHAKHFDYVLCDPATLDPRCAIELSDKSHRRAARQARDRFLAAACQHAALPLLTFDVRNTYSVGEVAATIALALGRHAPAEELAEVVPATPSRGPDGEEIGPRCPKCSAMMTKRTAKAGSNAGRDFWGCSNFPRCREIVPIPR